MAHYRKSLAAAVTLNTGIFVVETIAGLQAHSLSLLTDSIHNFSDEVALVFLFLAFILSQGVSRNLVRTANLFNSVGLIAVSALLILQAIDRLLHPEAVLGLFPIVVGVGA
jgi:cobalt-zinc-cadmium efflux system protein